MDSAYVIVFLTLGSCYGIDKNSVEHEISTKADLAYMLHPYIDSEDALIPFSKHKSTHGELQSNFKAPLAIILTPTDDNGDFKENRIMLLNSLNRFVENLRVPDNKIENEITLKPILDNGKSDDEIYSGWAKYDEEESKNLAEDAGEAGNEFEFEIQTTNNETNVQESLRAAEQVDPGTVLVDNTAEGEVPEENMSLLQLPKPHCVMKLLGKNTKDDCAHHKTFFFSFMLN